MKNHEDKHNSREKRYQIHETNNFDELTEFSEFNEDQFDEPAEFDEFDGFDEDDEDEFEERKKHPFIKSVLAIILILSFISLTIPSLNFLLSDRYDFLDQNKVLIKDDIVKLSKPAVVSVETRIKTGVADTQARQGTGFNISTEGKIVTNKHIVENAELITVKFGSGKSYVTRNYEVVSDADIAILDIDGADLPVLEINRNKKIDEGDVVTVIGNPLGYKKIAQRGKVVKFYQMRDSVTTVFEFDINVNQGNSGSPVINEQGEVIGVVFATVTHENEGIEVKRGLAIPISELPTSI